MKRLKTAMIVLTAVVFALTLTTSAYAGGSCSGKTTKEASAGCAKTATAKAGCGSKASCSSKAGAKGDASVGCTPAEKQLCNSKLAATAVNTSSLTFGVAYLTCDGCANTVNKSLQGVKGVLSVVVDYRTGTADVEFDSDLVTSASLIKAVEKAGFNAQVGPYSTSEMTKFADANQSGK